MRVQSVSSNNYQNNYLNKNITFKQNFRFVVRGLSGYYDEFCPQSKQALKSAFAEILTQCGESIKDFPPPMQSFIQGVKDANFLQLDLDSMIKLSKLSTIEGRSVFLGKIYQEAKEFELNWNDICPPYAAN